MSQSITVTKFILDKTRITPSILTLVVFGRKRMVKLVDWAREFWCWCDGEVFGDNKWRLVPVVAISDVLVVAVVDYICGGCGVIKARWRLISSTWHCNHTLHCTQATALRNAPQMIKGQGCKKVNSNSWYTTWYSGRSSCIDASKWTMQWWRIVCTTMRELRSHNGWWWNFGLCPLALLIRWSAADQVRSPVISSAAAHYRSCTHTRAVIRAAASIHTIFQGWAWQGWLVGSGLKLRSDWTRISCLTSKYIDKIMISCRKKMVVRTSNLYLRRIYLLWI